MGFHAARLRMPFTLGVCFALTLLAGQRAGAASALTAFSDAVETLQDYMVTITTHEVAGNRVQDRVQQFWFKKPLLVKIAVISGPGRGGVAVWHGGSTLRGHQGGFFGFYKMTLDIHDPRAESLSGDTIASAYFGDTLDHFRATKGTIDESAGPTMDGVATDEVSLTVADPSEDHEVTREVLYLSRVTHLPLKEDHYEGERVVKTELFRDFKSNVGLTDADFEL